MSRTFTAVILTLIAAFIPVVSPAQQGKGILEGTVVDGSTNETMIGVAVQVDSTSLGALTDLDGNYHIANVPAGMHTIKASMVGYAPTVSSINVRAGVSTRLDIVIQADAVEVEEVVVKAQAVHNTEAVLLKDRQEAEAVSDAVSAETITRSGSSNAAEAAKQVTGTTVVGGNSVYVRGLGDRYTNVQLNGSELPSTSQYNQTVQIDLFPSNMLDNIVTLKTFTPDKSGAFTGGSVNIETKSFPDALMISASSTATYNEGTSFSDNFLTYEGGSRDWLGYDDGTRDIPNTDKGSGIKDASLGVASHDMAVARKLDAYSKSFNSVMAPVKGYAPMNHSYSLSFGNNIRAAGRPLGFLGSLTYGRSYSSYTGGKSARWNLTSPTADRLDDYMNLSDSKSSDNVLWGALLNGAYRLSDNHVLGINFVHTQNGESYARILSGSYGENIAENATFVPNVLGYTERALTSTQLYGNHTFTGFHNIKVDWKSSYAKSKENEPDIRYFTYTYNKGFDGNLSYIVFANFYDGPTHYYRFLKESTDESKIDVTVPFTQWRGMDSSFKIGGLYSTKSRSFNERQFTFERDRYIRFDGDPETFFSAANIGLVDTTRTPYRFGLYIDDLSNNSSIYDGEQTIKAAYTMADMPLSRRLRFIGGARYETTYMKVSNPDTTGIIRIEDVLPSANLIYQPGETMNVRATYSRTLARPTIREMAPYTSFDYAASNFFIGNPHLKRTLIDNFDIRWEWFPDINDVYSVSVFVKNFNDPIERVLKNYNGEITFQNVDMAVVRGLELEARRSLPFIPALKAGGNLSLMKSEVTISPDEMIIIRAYDRHASNTRELMGQSPYVVNLDLSYSNERWGFDSGVYFNRYGKRLAANSLGGTPDVYEQPFSSLNASFSKKLTAHFSVKASGKNLLDSRVTMSQAYKGKDFITSQYSDGRSYSIGFTYNL